MTEFDFSGIKGMPKPQHLTEDGLSHALVEALKRGDVQVGTEGLNSPYLSSLKMEKGGFSQRTPYIAPRGTNTMNYQPQSQSKSMTGNSFTSNRQSTNTERSKL